MNRLARAIQRIPILNYHSVSDSPDKAMKAFSIAPRDLARQLDLVVAGGYTALTVSQLIELRDLALPVPDRTVVITFDDGFEDNLTAAEPLLAKRGLPATVFVTTGFLAGGNGSPYRPPGRMLDRDGVAQLEVAGIEIGSHAHSHRPLDVLSRAEAREEIQISKTVLEAILRHPVLSFAYPHGYTSRWVEDEVRRNGFRSACGVANAFSHPGDNPWHLARLTVGPSTTSDTFQSWLNGECASVASRHERLRTKGWRGARRAGERANLHLGTFRVGAP